MLRPKSDFYKRHNHERKNEQNRISLQYALQGNGRNLRKACAFFRNDVDCLLAALFYSREKPLHAERNRIPSLHTQANGKFISQTFGKDGFIRLEADSDNHRNKLLSFTEKGEELAKSTIDRVFELEISAFSRFDDEEADMFLALARKHVAMLSEESEKILKKRASEHGEESI